MRTADKLHLARVRMWLLGIWNRVKWGRDAAHHVTEKEKKGKLQWCQKSKNYLKQCEMMMISAIDETSKENCSCTVFYQREPSINKLC